MVENVEKCKLPRKRTSCPRVDWYKLLYDVQDDKLIKFFWNWFNKHKIRSKNRAARCALIKYYSTTFTAPAIVLDAFEWYRTYKVIHFNWLDCDEL